MSTELERLREQVERLARIVAKHFPDDVEAEKPANLAPKPWKLESPDSGQIVDANGHAVFYLAGTPDGWRATMDFLLLAVNSHDELVEALDDAIAWLEDVISCMPDTPIRDGGYSHIRALRSVSQKAKA